MALSSEVTPMGLWKPDSIQLIIPLVFLALSYSPDSPVISKQSDILETKMLVIKVYNCIRRVSQKSFSDLELTHPSQIPISVLVRILSFTISKIKPHVHSMNVTILLWNSPCMSFQSKRASWHSRCSYANAYYIAGMVQLVH